MSEQNPVDQDCQEPDPPPFPNADLPQGITFMTVLVFNNIKMPVLESDVLCTRTGIVGKRMPLPV